jgi:hypothetical protein
MPVPPRASNSRPQRLLSAFIGCCLTSLSRLRSSCSGTPRILAAFPIEAMFSQGYFAIHVFCNAYKAASKKN